MGDVIELYKFKSARQSHDPKNVFSDLCSRIIEDKRLSDRAIAFLFYVLNNTMVYRCRDESLSYYLNTSDFV
jgi:hypothetical protein